MSDRIEHSDAYCTEYCGRYQEQLANAREGLRLYRELARCRDAGFDTAFYNAKFKVKQWEAEHGNE